MFGPLYHPLPSPRNSTRLLLWYIIIRLIVSPQNYSCVPNTDGGVIVKDKAIMTLKWFCHFRSLLHWVTDPSPMVLLPSTECRPKESCGLSFPPEPNSFAIFGRHWYYQWPLSPSEKIYFIIRVGGWRKRCSCHECKVTCPSVYLMKIWGNSEFAWPTNSNNV